LTGNTALLCKESKDLKTNAKNTEMCSKLDEPLLIKDNMGKDLKHAKILNTCGHSMKMLNIGSKRHDRNGKTCRGNL